MRTYKGEVAFSRALLPKLRLICPMVMRIESGLTRRGIPDIYCRFHNRELWIELKNDNKQSLDQLTFYIPYRPGQKAWHMEYAKACGWEVKTIMAVRDGFVICHASNVINNNIARSNVFVYHTLLELMKGIAEVRLGEDNDY